MRILSLLEAVNKQRGCLAARPDPLKLAYLLRQDLQTQFPNQYKVRAQAPSNGVLDWWRQRGCYEYPAWANDELKRIYGERLLDPLSGWPIYQQFGMSPILLHLIANRPDLRDHFDIETQEGLWHAIAWLYIYGLNEHEAMSMVDQRVIQALDQVPPFFASASSTHSPTWLMFFLWRVSGELQAEFDLADEAQWDPYIAWFLAEGLAAYRLSPLVAQRWKQEVHHFLARQGTAAANNVIPTNLKWAFVQKAPKGQSKQRPFGVNLIGFAFGELGIGEDIRMAAEECEEAGIPVAIVNIDPGQHVRQKDLALLKYLKSQDSHESEDAPYAINIFVLTAFDTARVYLEKGHTLFDGRYNIGWWPWELPVWPKRWRVVFDLVDEIWAGSRFTADTYKRAAKLAKIDLPIKTVPLRVSVDRLKPMTRQALGLPEKRFLFLYVFDSNSYLTRKNPMAALKAFQKAFPEPNAPVSMVFKTMNPRKNNPEYMRFKNKCLADKRVVLLEKTLDRGEVLGLIQSCDAYVSLHRAEGFGRTIAEALMLGKPAIATDFSGSKDFVKDNAVSWIPVKLKAKDYPFVMKDDHAWWAEPSISDAARKMKNLMTTTSTQ
jgi:glycosyltransferase involved in cell wall biosynthesis